MDGNLRRIVSSPETKIDIGLLPSLERKSLRIPTKKNHPALGWFSFCFSAVLATGPQTGPVAFSDTAVHRVELVADAFDCILVQVSGLHV